MTTNQEARHQDLRDSTSTARGMTEDWHALWDGASVADGTFNERLLAWINAQLSSSYTNLSGAMHAYAADGGFSRWSDINAIVTSSGPTYAVNGNEPATVADFAGVNNNGTEYYRKAGSETTFDGLISYTGNSLGTMMDSDGALKWKPHNLVINSDSPANQNVTTVVGAQYTVKITGTGSVALTGAGTGTVTAGSPVTITASTTTLTLTLTGSPTTMWCFRSDLGGMVNDFDGGTDYVENTTGSARFLSRRNHYRYNGTSYVKKGILLESAAATNLQIYSRDIEATGTSVTNATADNYSATGVDGVANSAGTLSFIENAIGAYWLGSANVSVSSGTTYCIYAVVGEVDTDIVQLTVGSSGFGTTVFQNYNLTTGATGTPGAAVTGSGIEEIANGWHLIWLTAPASGTVANARVILAKALSLTDGRLPSTVGGGATDVLLYHTQVEAGSLPSSIIPTNGATASRSAETLSIAAGEWCGATQPTAVSAHIQGETHNFDVDDFLASRMLYALSGSGDYFDLRVDQTPAANTGNFEFLIHDGTTTTAVTTGADELAEGLNASYSVAVRAIDGEVAKSVNGATALSASSAGVLGDVHNAALQIHSTTQGTTSVALVRVNNADWTDTGIEEASA